jgi:acyl-CoA synthetase (AMP-forming)/AMP-acid ligase II
VEPGPISRNIVRSRGIVAFPAGGDLREALREAFARYADRVALVTERTRWSFAELSERTRRLANLFDSLGVEPGGFLGAVLSPRPEIFCELYLARAEHGAPLFGLSPLLPPEAMAGALRSASPRVVVYDAAIMPRFPEFLRQTLPGARPLAARGPQGDWEGLLAGASTGSIGRRIDPAALTAVGYTSGTTGAPKGVTMTHRAVAECARRFTDTLGAVFSDDGPRGFLTGIPVFAAGSGTIIPALLAGMTNYIPDRFDASRALQSIREGGLEAGFVTPSMLIDLLDEDGLEPSARSLELLIYGSANTPTPRIEEAVRRLGPILLQGYGMSELLPPVAILWPEEHGTRERPAGREVLSSTGEPCEGVKVRIEGPAGEALAPGEVGEIVIESATVTAGYWMDPAKTAESLQSGWWRSSDAGYLDGSGRLHVLDRMKDLIERGGRTIYPRRLEEACGDYPAVKEAAAVQMPGSDQVILAVSLRLRDRDRLDSGAIRRELTGFLAQRLDPAERPDGIELMTELPRSLQGKVLKREVRDALAARST